MAELAKLVGIGRTDIIPEYTLMPLRPEAYARLQRQFEATYFQVGAVSSASLPMGLDGKPGPAAQFIMDTVNKTITAGRFAYGCAEFDYAFRAIDHLPHILAECLKEKHPKMNPIKAALLYDMTTSDKVLRGCMECAGYVFKKKAVEGENQNPTTGMPPSAPSSSEAEAGNK